MTVLFRGAEKFGVGRWSVFGLSYKSLTSASGQRFCNCNFTNLYCKIATVKNNGSIRVFRGSTHDLLTRSCRPKKEQRRAVGLRLIFQRQLGLIKSSILNSSYRPSLKSFTLVAHCTIAWKGRF